MDQKYSTYYSRFFHSEKGIIEAKFLELIIDENTRNRKVIILRNNMNNKKLFNICSDIKIYEANLNKFNDDLNNGVFDFIGIDKNIIEKIVSIKNDLC